MPRNEKGRFVPADPVISPADKIPDPAPDPVPPVDVTVFEDVTPPIPAVPAEIPADITPARPLWQRLALGVAVAAVPGAAVGYAGWWLAKRWRKAQ